MISNICLLDVFFSQRKNADNLKFSLGEIVVAVFCTSLVGAGEDQKVKLNKVIAVGTICLSKQYVWGNFVCIHLGKLLVTFTIRLSALFFIPRYFVTSAFNIEIILTYKRKPGILVNDFRFRTDKDTGTTTVLGR